MERIKKILWGSLSCLLFILFATHPASATSGGVVIPPGFHQIDSAAGIELYQKNYPGGSPDYVQVLDLSQGASLKPLHGSITDPGAGKGSYGGNDARFRSKSLGAYWQELRAQEPSAYCVVNGQFFYMPEYPTRLPFPLKIDGQILTDGYGIRDFPDQKLMLELWPGKADIVPLSKEALYTSTAPDIIAGLTEEAPKAKKRFTGRTFIGLTGANPAGTFDTLLVFNTQTARQVDAASVLKSFGAQKVMMLDGGGSTQLLCHGKSYIYSDRLVPQAIGIVAGEPGSIPQEVSSTPPEQTQAATAAGSSSEKQVSSASYHLAPAALPLQTYLASIFKSPPVAQDPAGRLSAASLANPAAGDPSQSLPAPTVSQPAAIAQPAAPGGQSTPVQPATETRSNLAAEGQSQEPGAVEITGGQSTPDSLAPQSQAALAAGVAPVNLGDVLWVPASMAPVLMFLLLAISKFRGRGG